MSKWYYLVQDQKQGPVDAVHITELEAAGIINEMTPILQDNASEWIELRNSDLAARSTPCQVINRIGRIERIYRDFRFVLSVSFWVNCVLAVVMVMRFSEVRQSKELVNLALLALESPFGAILAALVVLFFALVLISWGILLHRIALVIPAEMRKIHPGLGAILSSAPVVSMVANFWIVPALNRSLTFQQRKEGVVAKRPSVAMAWTYVILNVLFYSPLLPLMIFIFMYLVWGAVARQFKDAACNILHQRLME